MLVIENCNSLSELRQKLIDGEEVRTARQEPCEGAISRAKALEAIRKLPHAGWLFSAESVLNVLSDLPPVTPLEQEPCEDAIRREDAIDAVSEALEHVVVENEDVARKMMNKLPSVNSQPKTGHWIRELIRNEKGGCIGAKMICSECGNDNKHDEYMIYCPNCGAKMVEPQESERV